MNSTRSFMLTPFRLQVATFAVALCLVAGVASGETIEQSFGRVAVTLRTTNVPPDLAIGSPQSPGYSMYTSIVVSLAIKVSGQSVYVPLDAFAGIGEPRSVDVQAIALDRRWRLKLAGGDAATAYCAIMDFDSIQIRTVKLFGSCQGKVPFATKLYAKIKVLN